MARGVDSGGGHRILCDIRVDQEAVQVRARQPWYWIVASDPETRQPYLIFGGATEEEARQKGLEMLPGINFEIRMFRTRHLATASSCLRGLRLDGQHSLRDAGRRQGHTKSLKRLRRRMLHRNE